MCFSHHSIIYDKEGESLFAFGYNGFGQLGLPNTLNQPAPQQISFSAKVRQIASGYGFSLLLLEDGTLYTCGKNSFVRTEPPLDPSSPFRKEELPAGKQIACGVYHSLALTMDGEVYAWGHNGSGQLGLGQGPLQNHSHPQKVSIPERNVRQVACGGNHSMVLLEDGTAYSWGSNDHGQLGLGHENPQQAVPEKITSLSNIRQICCGYRYSACLLEDGSIFTWGENNTNQSKSSLPVKLNGRFPDAVKQIVSGITHSMVLLVDGSVYAWGNNDYGQLGIGSEGNQMVPMRVVGLEKIEQIFCGGSHSMAIDAAGELYTWGHNFYGQLGLNHTNNHNEPQKVSSLSGKKLSFLNVPYSSVEKRNFKRKFQEIKSPDTDKDVIIQELKRQNEMLMKENRRLRSMINKGDGEEDNGKDSTKDKEQEKKKENNTEKEKETKKDKDKEKENDTEKEKETKKDKEKETDTEKEKKKDDTEKETKKDKEKEKEKENDTEKETEKKKEKEEEKEKEKKKEKEKEEEKEKEKGKKKEQEKEKEKEKKKGRKKEEEDSGKEKRKDKRKSKRKSKGKEKQKDKSKDKAKDKAKDKGKDEGKDKDKEKDKSDKEIIKDKGEDKVDIDLNEEGATTQSDQVMDIQPPKARRVNTMVLVTSYDGEQRKILYSSEMEEELNKNKRRPNKRTHVTVDFGEDGLCEGKVTNWKGSQFLVSFHDGVWPIGIDWAWKYGWLD